MAETKIRARKATALLREDHAKVKKLYAQYEEAGEDGKAEIYREIEKGLMIHTQIEEEIFYPAIQVSDDEDAERLVREAHEEHRLVKGLFAELSSMTPGEPAFEAKFKVLIDNVLHHVEEEHEDVFPIFDELSKDERDEISERLAERKRELEG